MNLNRYGETESETKIGMPEDGYDNMESAGKVWDFMAFWSKSSHLISNNSTTNNLPLRNYFSCLHSPSTIKNPLTNMNFRRWGRGGGGRRVGKGENNSTAASNERNKCEKGQKTDPKGQRILHLLAHKQVRVDNRRRKADKSRHSHSPEMCNHWVDSS